MNTTPVEALIVGAGPVGLTMVAGLMRQGMTCRIIDKAPLPSDKSKALVVWSRTLELLGQLDLAETFVQAGMKIRGASIYGNGKRLVHVEIAGVDSPFGFPLMIPQCDTERLLTEHLARHGLAVERQVELVSFTEGPDAVAGKLKLADGSEQTFAVPWLIGCDGAHSTIRHTLGMPFTGEAEQNDWLLADIHVAGPLAADEMSIFWHEKGILAFFPITPQRFRVIADLGPAAATGKPAEPTLADVQAKVDERGPGGLTLLDPVWLAGFRINERKVADYRHGRVFLAGDAAHIHSPAGGQGMNTGMQDAFNLAWKLALVERGAGQAQPLLDSYSLERSAVGDQVLHGAGMMTLVATLRNPLAQYARNRAASMLCSFGFVQDKFKSALCELSINYRHSPLSAEKWPKHAGGLHAGDRLPDASLTSVADGSETTLFAEMSADRHTLLLLPCSGDGRVIAQLVELAGVAQQAFPDVLSAHVILGAGKDAPATSASGGMSPVSRWVDSTGELHQKLGANEPTVMVVRPDGYLGYRCQPADIEGLLAYLSGYLVRKG
ncbi:MAG: FAD-dependent monooxygenase [Planctomycetia bacterium]|nr:FAD-dependent monooxygenase [Planctomycetia bacterium]